MYSNLNFRMFLYFFVCFRIQTAVITNLLHKDPMKFLDDCQEVFGKRIPGIIKTHETLKLNATFCGEFIKKIGDKEAVKLKYFSTRNSIISSDDVPKDWFNEKIKHPLLTELEEFDGKGSGWSLHSIVNLELGKLKTLYVYCCLRVKVL